MPTAWTSVAPEDPFVKVAAGRSAFRVADLLALADLLDGLATEDAGGDGPDAVEVDPGIWTVS